MRRRSAAWAVVAVLILGAVPAAAVSPAQAATCRVESGAVHHKLRGFGVASVGGTVDVVAALACVDVAQESFVAVVRVAIEAVKSDGTPWSSAAERYCSADSSAGVVVLTCSASLSYDDPALTDATFRGCVDLMAPVDLPRRCFEAVATP